MIVTGGRPLAGRTRLSMTRIAAGLSLLATVVAASGCTATRRQGGGGGIEEDDFDPGGELPTIEEARQEARKALPVIQFLDDNRHNVAETLGFRTGEDFGEIVLRKDDNGDPEPPLPVYEISLKDLKWSEAFPAFKKQMAEVREDLSEAEAKRLDRALNGPNGDKPARSFTELFSRLPEGEGAELSAMFLFLEIMLGAQEHVLEALGEQEPEAWVFQATKERDANHLTPIVVRVTEADRTRWRLFKVGQAPLAKMLRCTPDALYILDIPALYLSFVARPPGEVNPADVPEECRREEEPQLLVEGEDCLIHDGKTALPPQDQRPSADDCLVAIHSFPDLYDIEAGQRQLFTDWFPIWELLAKTWRGSVENSYRFWMDLPEPGQ